MIKYKLICKDCSVSFDSWFASSNEFEKLKNKKYLNCPKCNSYNIDKTLMAPKVVTKTGKHHFEKKNLKLKNINKKIKEYQTFIKNNFDFVGENFAYEARSIHYGEKKRKKKKGIFGTASQEEIKDLKDEGINAETIPWIEDKSN